jgi:hypothetical protein
MKAFRRLVAIEVLFLVLGILGGRVALIFMDTTLIWRDLGTPPDKAVRIVDGDYRSVRVQTSSGDIYYCHFNSPRQCWIHNDHPSYFPYTYDKPFVLRSYSEPPVLSGVVDTKSFYSNLSEYSQVLSIYAITAKGKVYVWQDGFGSPYDAFILIYALPIAVLCGLVFWGLFELRWLLFPKKSDVAVNGN